MNSSGGDRPQRRPGFPIRTPSDQRLVGSSPRHFAASHVLHRPPDAKASTVCPYNTTHKTTKQNKLLEQIYRKIKMLASTIQFSHNTNHHHTNQNQQAPAGGNDRTRKNQQPTNHQPHPHTGTEAGNDGRCLPRHPTAHRHTHLMLKAATCGQQASTQKMRTPPPASTGRPASRADLVK